MLNIIIGVLIVWSAILTFFVYILSKMIGGMATSMLTLQAYVKTQIQEKTDQQKTSGCNPPGEEPISSLIDRLARETIKRSLKE